MDRRMIGRHGVVKESIGETYGVIQVDQREWLAEGRKGRQDW